MPHSHNVRHFIPLSNTHPPIITESAIKKQISTNFIVFSQKNFNFTSLFNRQITGSRMKHFKGRKNPFSPWNHKKLIIQPVVHLETHLELLQFLLLIDSKRKHKLSGWNKSQSAFVCQVHMSGHDYVLEQHNYQHQFDFQNDHLGHMSALSLFSSCIVFPLCNQYEIRTRFWCGGEKRIPSFINMICWLLRGTLEC